MYPHTPLAGPYLMCDWNGKVGEIIRVSPIAAVCSECRKEVAHLDGQTFKFHQQRVTKLPARPADPPVGEKKSG